MIAVRAMMNPAAQAAQAELRLGLRRAIRAVRVHIRRRVGLVQKSIEFPAVMRTRVGHVLLPDQLVPGIRIHVVLVAVEALAVLLGPARVFVFLPVLRRVLLPRLMPGSASARARASGLPSWTCGSRSAWRRPRMRRKPRFCSTSSISSGISARPWMRCARANMAALPRPALHQGPEIHLAVAPGEPDARRQAGLEDAVGCQQAAQHGLCPQGEFRPIVDLRA